jgi:capsule biosynthesis phosphatase
MKRLIVDLDDTISVTVNGDYRNSQPVFPIIEMLKKYKNKGFEIVIYSSRNMRTYETNVGKINIYTLPNIIEWLQKNDVPFDEVYVGKPWCGFDGFYIDDKAIRPSEFLTKSYDEIMKLLKKEKELIQQ